MPNDESVEVESLGDQIRKKLLTNIDWESLVSAGIEKMLLEHVHRGNSDHIAKTPIRFVNALHEYLSGYKADPGPEETLKTSFEEKHYDQMVFVNDISFYSLCIHHLAPFAGKVHFGYIPNGKIVGLSKIPRVVEIFAHRLQTQEMMSNQIVQTFFDVIEPRGCGVVIEAVHFCMCARGIKKPGSWTRTSALRGNFLDHPGTKEEFLAGAKRLEGSLL